MQKQCQDGFYTTFSSYRKMLDYHQEQSMNSRWIKSKVSDLEIQPLGKGSALSADLTFGRAGPAIFRRTLRMRITAAQRN